MNDGFYILNFHQINKNDFEMILKLIGLNIKKCNSLISF